VVVVGEADDSDMLGRGLGLLEAVDTLAKESTEGETASAEAAEDVDGMPDVGSPSIRIIAYVGPLAERVEDGTEGVSVAVVAGVPDLLSSPSHLTS